MENFIMKFKLLTLILLTGMSASQASESQASDESKRSDTVSPFEVINQRSASVPVKIAVAMPALRSASVPVRNGGVLVAVRSASALVVPSETRGLCHSPEEFNAFLSKHRARTPNRNIVDKKLYQVETEYGFVAIDVD
jgi:hypothetical protein